MPITADDAPREVHFTFVCSRHDVDAVARHAGVTVSEDEAAAILDHIDREIDSVARLAAAAAVESRIAALVEVVRSAHPSPDTHSPQGVQWPRRLSMC